MCYTEESLETTPASDHKVRKRIFEKLGDGACFLKRYAKGVEYYKKMLNEAELCGGNASELIPCYISLAQTYKDIGDYSMALQYFQKEYNLNKHNIKESVVTLFNIADVMEAAGEAVEDINKIYSHIRKKCQQSNAIHLEGKTLKRHIDFLTNRNELHDTVKLKRELVDLNYVESDEESDDDNNTPNIGEDLEVDDITDVSDENVEEEEVSVKKPTRFRGMTIKKNKKGETLLHTACINGNVDMVKTLLGYGHPVDVRDNAGWLPIHEACICGHLEIVKLLVEQKADINDRGGKECSGKRSSLIIVFFACRI